MGVVETKLKTQAMDDNKWWKCLWDLEVPPKLKHFIWCASHVWLGIKTELKRRRVVEDDICQLCRVAKEIINHVLF